LGLQGRGVTRAVQARPAPSAPWQGALVALGLLPPVAAQTAAQMADELAWLGGTAARPQPFAAVTHCLCVAP
jgi:hypothetical protein